MGIGRYAKGWGDLDDYDDYGRGRSNGGGGRITENERLYRFRFQVPTPEGTDNLPNLTPGRPATKRLLFLDGEPFVVYEHGFWTQDGRFGNAYKILGSTTAVCLKKNQLHKECPPCSPKGGDLYAYSIGFFPVIDMGQVKYENGKLQLLHHTWVSSRGKEYERKFQRVLLGAKKGSQDKPGVLKTLQYEMQTLQDRNGWKDLTGTVWDTTRTGKQDATVGTVWKFVERILPADYEDYLVRHGADPESLNLEIPVFTNDRDGIFDLNVEDYYEKLARVVGWRGGSSLPDRSKSTSHGAGYGGSEQVAPQRGYAEGAGYGGGGSGYAPSGPYGDDAPPPGDDDIPF